MGWIVHHAIVVTTFNQQHIEQAWHVARAIFGELPPPVESLMNGYWSFLIPPDGSNEGWPDSDTGDARRAQFHAWIVAQAYEDGSDSYDCIEVAYGEVRQAVVMVEDGRETGAEIEGC